MTGRPRRSILNADVAPFVADLVLKDIPANGTKTKKIIDVEIEISNRPKNGWPCVEVKIFYGGECVLHTRTESRETLGGIMQYKSGEWEERIVRASLEK